MSAPAGTTSPPDPTTGVRPVERAVRTYLDHLVVERGVAANTLSSYRRDLRRDLGWLAEQGIEDLAGIDEPVVTGFLVRLREGDGEHPPLSSTSAARTVVAVRGFHRFAVADGLVGHDPAAGVRPPQPAKRLPKALPLSDVEAILEASARLLARDGWSKATTNRIAAAAGVSVGSLYQYFPSKDAIAVELLRRYRERLTATVARKLAQTERVTFEGAVGTLLEALFDAEGIDARLHRVLIEQVLRTSSRGDLAGFEERLEALVVAALERAGAAASTPNKGLAATVVVRSVLSLVHAVVLDRPDLDRAEMAREATKLITRYLA